MDETDRALAASPYLGRHAPSRLDVTVAALLTPACRPPEHLLRWPAEMPPLLAAFLGDLEGPPHV